MRLDSEEILQLAFDLWRIYQAAHGWKATVTCWKNLPNEEEHVWINLAVYVYSKLEEQKQLFLSTVQKSEKRKRRKQK